MNLIIASQLAEPPSQSLCFRHLTMEAKLNLFYDVTIESPKDMVDNYYKFLKRRGMFDFIDDIIVPEWRIEGVRIDTELNYPKTVQTKSIIFENTLELLGQIKCLRNI